ncbi:uncharacterized protein LOC131232327 [Magnolia sinica]|uniref:uncharacterized protein LOC131232327 n=1 Tax=Magnolia sinica TaxID=86752 RepID=UPI0026585822|nr:uncharacterized protein LOC131232327 [Magnolia sinica]
MSANQIIGKTSRWLRDIGSYLPSSLRTCSQEEFIMQSLGIEDYSPTEAVQIQLIKWSKPDARWLKVNIDGSIGGNLGTGGGGGGICRDHRGELIVGFHNSYGRVTNTYVEAQAMADRLQICKNMGLSNIIVESDS